jgi:hypothetical protein
MKFDTRIGTSNPRQSASIRGFCFTLRFLRLFAAITGLLLFAGTVLAERDRLYSEPDPASAGGIKGVVAAPGLPVRQVLAIPPDEPRLVYEASLGGSDGRSFEFHGLPMRKYDLVVIFDDRFFEGLTLSREGDTLTAEDRQKIGATVAKAEPYFTDRIIHRVEGTTGRGNEARCICTFLRDRASTNGSEFRRTFRLIMLKDVGPGWQVVRSRDLYPIWTTPQLVRPAHHYDRQLSRIRVMDEVKDVGELRLGGS